MNRNPDSQPLELMLLDLHLRRLDPSGAQLVEDAIAHSPELAFQSQALRDVLNLLDRYEAAEPPDDLADKVLAHVSERTGVIPFPQPAAGVHAPDHRELSGSPVLSLRELVAIAACITLFIGVFIPGYYKASSMASRSGCLRNMAQLYTATTTYAEANAGGIPAAGYVPNGYWQPVRIPNVMRASNTRHFFLLLATGHVKEPRVFLCPADTEARPMLVDGGDYTQFHDFAERANNSYSFLIMNLEESPKMEDFQKQGAARMALLADRNPLFDSRSASHINPYDEATFNSPTHENGSGQNILYADGHVAWSTSPLVGVDRDNIYRCGQLASYQGNERPTTLTDSFLP
jgi:prepilin-type processing-associated H-X9-DG protein